MEKKGTSFRTVCVKKIGLNEGNDQIFQFFIISKL